MFPRSAVRYGLGSPLSERQGDATLGADNDVDLPARTAYQQALQVTGAQWERLSVDTLAGLAREVVSQLPAHLQSQLAMEQGPTQAAFDTFVAALISDSPAQAAELIDVARRSGTPVDSIYLAYLGPAAQELGERWERDELDFVQVTVGVGHLYAILRGLRPVPAFSGDAERRALFLTMPGDDHVLGAAIAADLFRSRDWQVEQVAPRDQSEAVAALVRGDFPVVGVSASRKEQVADLARLVVALRIARPETFILLGGPITQGAPAYLDVVDVDASVTSALGALTRLEDRIAMAHRSR